MNIRKRTWEIIETAKPGDKYSRIFDVAILILIFLNVAAVIIGSVRSVSERWRTFLNVFKVFSVAIFSIEYLARLWSCTSDLQFHRPLSVGGFA